MTRPRSPVLITVVLVLMLVTAVLVAVVTFQPPASGEMHSSTASDRIVTANVGRSAPWPVRRTAIRRVPLGITGWQEIDADDRGHEHRMIRRDRPRHQRACWRTSVPVTVPPATRLTGQRVSFLHRAIKPGISSRRVLCEARLRLADGTRVAVLNGQLVAKAHSGGRNRRERVRTRLWWKGWHRVRARVRHHLQQGRQVYLVGDFNNARLPSPHRSARTLMARRNDYVIAVPGRVRVLHRRAVRLGVDGHRALRVKVRTRT